MKNSSKKDFIEKIIAATKKHCEYYGKNNYNHEIYIDTKFDYKSNITITKRDLKRYGLENRFNIMRFIYKDMIYMADLGDRDIGALYRILGDYNNFTNEPTYNSELIGVEEVKSLLFPLIIKDYNNISKWISKYEMFFKHVEVIKKQIPFLQDIINVYGEANE